ncbi:hypothetical protein GGS26DRAFT_570730 [Hypomontagnella submonticulosa]|nr:hypothetical protein GGS26DRAFT_570730 [Hypomontagnella submonticulosa]
MEPCDDRGDVFEDTPEQRQYKEDREQEARLVLLVREIQTIYDAGTPIYTKDAIRKVGDELKLFKNGEPGPREITLPGLNGVDYKYSPIRHLPTAEDWKWVICYSSIEGLTFWQYAPSFHLQIAHLPMRITTSHLWNPHQPHCKKAPVPSTEDVHRAFQDTERQWKASEYQDKLQETLASLKIPFALDKVIGFALGPLSLEFPIDHRRIIQHALISVLHSTLLQRGSSSKTFQRYVQDPWYTQKDKDVLSSEGFTILDDPEAFLTLDNSSILVSINPNVPVKQITADICRPGIIIWAKAKSLDEIPKPCTDPDSSRVSKMIEEEYYEVDFPCHESFLGLGMYIRKSTQ